MALSLDRFVASVLGMGKDTIEASGIDPKTHAVVRLAAHLAVDAAPSSYNASARLALASEASHDEIVGILIAVAPATGLARAVSAARRHRRLLAQGDASTIVADGRALTRGALPKATSSCATVMLAYESATHRLRRFGFSFIVDPAPKPSAPPARRIQRPVKPLPYARRAAATLTGPRPGRPTR